MADEKQVFEIDLDSKAFVEGAEKALESLDALKDVESFKNLISTLKNLGLIFAALSAAVLAVKASMDFVFEGEEIKAINQQFEILAKNAKLAGDTIKEKMVHAAAGLADDTDIIKAANDAIITMGANAAKLPEIMELARKVTAVMGGDLVKNFQALNFAIATGNERALKHMGIVIDSNKAQRDYAKSIGETVSVLSEEGRQAATLQAVLEKGKTAFKGVDLNVKEATNTYKELVVTLGQIKEAFVVTFEKTVGPLLTSFLRKTADVAKYWQMILGGDEVERAKYNIVELTKKIDDLQGKIKYYEGLVEDSSKRPLVDKLFFVDEEGYKNFIKNYKIRVEKFQNEIKAIKEKFKLDEEKEAETPKATAKGKTDLDLVLQQRAKQNVELLEMQRKRIIETRKLEQDEVKALQEFEEQKDILKKLYAAKEFELEQNREYNAKAKAAKKLELEKELHVELLKLEEERKLVMINAADQALKHAVNYTDGFAKAAHLSGLKASKDLKDYGLQGQKTFDILQKNSADAFLALGDGSKNAGDAMKGFLFGSLADIAEAQGRLHMLAGFSNPAEFAAGAALMVLAGYLRSEAKSATASSLGSSSAGSSAAPTGSTGETTTPTSGPPQGEPQKQKSVTLQIMGNYYETAETKTKLLEMIREATDATDFKYVQIGQR